LSFFQKIIPIFLTSLTFEVIQLIFGIGATDISDLIMNTVGGTVGIGILYVFVKVFKDKSSNIVKILALAVYVLVLAFIVLQLRFKV
jgi:glycopeptide antibiotics resistance protein